MATIDLFGAVGDIWDDGFSPEDVSAMLEEAGDGDLTVRINSPGGIASDGVAIYNMLADRGPRVEVMGLAASAASVIAMAGREVVMRRGARMMIHDPWSGTIGDASEHLAAAERLDALGHALAEIYAGRTGGTPQGMRELMLAETWMHGDEAVSRGFATSMEASDAAPDPEESQAVLATMNCRNDLAKCEADRQREINRRAYIRARVKELTHAADHA